MKQIIKEEKGEENDHQSGDLSCDHSKEKEKKTHHGWIQCGDFHCQHHKGGSITAASHHHHLKTQDPRSKTHFRSSQKQQRQDS